MEEALRAQPEISEESTVKEETKIYTVVEMGPEAPKGMERYRAYIAENIRYSTKARKAGIEGKVFVKFTVKTDGTLENFEVLKSLHPDLDQEAIRVLKEGGSWKPAKRDGKVVQQNFVFPVIFTLPK